MTVRFGSKGERSRSSDFFGSHAAVENENENEDDSGGTIYRAKQIQIAGLVSCVPPGRVLAGALGRKV
jgi:hypothetical protein